MGISRYATAHWEGDLKSGQGHLSTPESGLMDDTAYGFASRFGDRKGVNPEELIAAAHAGCFSMAFAHGLSQAGHTPKRIHTVAKVHLEKTADGFRIPKIELETDADVPGIDDAALQQQGEQAKQNCPVSKVLAGAEITLKLRRQA